MFKLRDVQVRNAKPREKPYKLCDGIGLYVLIKPNGSKLFRLNYRYDGKQKTLALGQYPIVTLEQAREKALEAKKLLAQGIDPSKAKKERASTFRDVAQEWLNIVTPEWSKSHAEKVVGRLNNYLLPVLGNLKIDQITTEDILKVLNAIRTQGKAETVKRVKMIASQIFRYAIIKGVVQNDPTYALRGLIPTSKPKHYPAPTSPEELAKILKLVWAYPYVVVRNALKVLVYTFQRPGEVRQMLWQDVDFVNLEWRFVASKTHQPHVVPLSRQVVEILREMEAITKPISPYVFPSPRSFSRPLSDMAMNVALKSLGVNTKEEITGHGFRAAARTMLAERLNFPPDAIEIQLAHTVPDRLGQAYNRAKYLDVRREMMQAWADFVDSLI